jgi:hypothetical protein
LRLELQEACGEHGEAGQ